MASETDMRAMIESFNDWMEDHENYGVFFWAMNLVVVGIAVVLCFLLPRYSVLTVLITVGILLSMWRFHMDATWQSLLAGRSEFPDPPKGWAAVPGCLRLGLLGAIVNYAAVLLILEVLGREVTRPYLVPVAMTLAVVAGVFNKTVLIYMLLVWVYVTSIVFDGLAVLIALTRTGEERNAALGSLFRAENQLFVSVAGFDSGSIFGTEPEILRNGLPCARPL